MLINSFLSLSQKIFAPIYNKSFVLKNIDTLIFINILMLILSTSFAPSDSIGIFAIIIIILTAIKLLTKSGELLNLNNADKFLLLYFIFVLISLAGSSLLTLSLKGFSKTVIYLGFYASFIHYLKDNLDKLKYIILTIIITTLGETAIAFKQNFLAVSEISGWQDMSRLNPEEIMTRVYGSLKPYNPNLFGGYLLATIPASLYIINKFINKALYKLAVLGLILFLANISAIIMTGCRGAYIGLFFELIAIAIIIYKKLKPSLKKIFTYLTSASSVLILLFILSKASLRARIFSIFAMRSDSSNSFRFNVYNSCIDMFKDNWLLGIGIGNQNFREIYGLYMKTGFDALSAYNIYLETAVESGIFALLAFVGFLILNLTYGIKYIGKCSDKNSIFVIIALVSIIGMLMHGFVDTVFFRPQIQFIFWIMIGIIRVITSNWGNYDNRKN